MDEQEAPTEADVVPAAFPVTGHADIDAALAALELDGDVHTHPEALSAVLDVIAAALRTSPQPPLPHP